MGRGRGYRRRISRRCEYRKRAQELEAVMREEKEGRLAAQKEEEATTGGGRWIQPNDNNDEDRGSLGYGSLPRPK